MKLLFIFPFCSPEVNSISGGPLYLGANGHEVLLITSKAADSLKGRVSAPEHEQVEKTEFYRPYAHSRDIIQRPSVCWQEVKSKVKQFQPDVVFGFGEFNYKLPLRISREFKIPMYLYMEYLRREKVAFPMRGRSILRRFLPKIHDWLADRFLRYLSKNVTAIMYAYYGDRKYAEKVCAYGAPVHYVPWCNEVYKRSEATALDENKDRKTGIYIGSLAGFKNAAELVKAIPIILEQSNTSRFTVVGPGSYADEIKKLVEQYPQRLFYKESVSRDEAMQMIREAGYGFTPVKDCGLGFIGDCWASGTPLVALHDLDSYLKDTVDTLIVRDVGDLSAEIDQLISSNEMYIEYAHNGMRRYNQNYTANAIGEKYLSLALTA